MAFRRANLLGEREGKRGICWELFTQGVDQQVFKDLPLVLLFDLAFGPIVSVARSHVLGFTHLDDDLIAQIAAACWDSLKR